MITPVSIGSSSKARKRLLTVGGRSFGCRILLGTAAMAVMRGAEGAAASATTAAGGAKTTEGAGAATTSLCRGKTIAATASPAAMANASPIHRRRVVEI